MNNDHSIIERFSLEGTFKTMEWPFMKDRRKFSCLWEQQKVVELCLGVGSG